MKRSKYTDEQILAIVALLTSDLRSELPGGTARASTYTGWTFELRVTG